MSCAAIQDPSCDISDLEKNYGYKNTINEQNLLTSCAAGALGLVTSFSMCSDLTGM